MLDFRSGSSNAVNSVNAVHESMDLVLGGEALEGPSLIIFHSTMGHNFSQIMKTAKEISPQAQICGCTGSGVVSSEGVSEKMRALAMMVVTGNEFAVATVRGLGNENTEELAQQCAQSLKEQLSGINMVYVLGPGINVCGESIVDGIEAVFGPEVTLFGALAGDNAKLKRTVQFYGEEVLEDGLILVGFADPSLEMVQACHHGSLGNPDIVFEVTKSSGNRVDELNGGPAWPTLLEQLNLSPDMEPNTALPFTGMGIELDEVESQAYDNKHILCAPFTLSEDRNSFYMLVKCPVGTRLIPVYRDEDHIFNGVDRMMQRMTKDLDGSTPLAVFQSDCMARGRMTHDEVNKDEIIAKMQNPICAGQRVPWLGVYGFAEFCRLAGRNRFHHYTTSLSAIVRRG